VVAAAPFNVIAAPDTNPVPVAVKVNEGLPAVTAAGEIALRPNEAPVTVRVIVPEVVLSGFIARMLTAPAVAIWAAVIFAVSCVVDDTVVESGAPFQRIVVPLT
jgi:hypothetical protein